MKRLRIALGLILMFFSASVMAQDGFEEWLRDGRPECFLSDSAANVRPMPRRKLGTQETAPLKARGVKHVPVILVAFNDVKFSAAPTGEEVNAFYNLFCNGTRDGRPYTRHGSHGSIRDYFIEQSDSVFQPEFTVVGPVELDSAVAYYGANLSGRDSRVSSFYREATMKAMEVHQDWEAYDNDGNGSIDMVFFIFAGLGENNTRGMYPDLLWPKENTSSITLNGKTFATYAMTCECRPAQWNEERTQVTKTKTDGIGVFIHELSHALGLPDFYDTNYKAFGMDLWSVMDYGEYGGDGFNPGNYTAYERDFMGWRPLKTLDRPCVLTIPCFADGGFGYKIQNDSAANEYYIIENRQPRGWDDWVGQRGHGLQVTHVDYDASRWRSNRVNAVADHQRMTIIAANDNYRGTNYSDITRAEWYVTLAGNLFPGDAYKYDLTDESTPAATVYTGGLIHKPLRNITENEDGTVTVCYCTNGQLDVPEVEDPDNVQMDQFDVRWDAVDNATRYAYELYKDEALVRCDTVAEAEVHVDGLQPGSALEFRVKAMADIPEDYVDSDWSDFVRFSTLADFVDGLSESSKWVDVYALNGVCVSRCYADELERLALRRGVYIVRYSSGASRKVLLP